MGNNKGRSKGCVTCLKRRVKCDQNHPTCFRCEKAGFTCLGYRGTLFIDGQAQVLRRLNRAAPSQLKKSSSPQELRGGRQRQATEDDDLQNILQICPSPSGSPMRNGYFISYLVTNLHGPMKVMCQSLVPRTAGEQCFIALATTFYGLGKTQKPLMDDGRRHYLRALRMVNAIISENSCAGTADTLSSIFALCLHEAIAPTESNHHSWLNHVYGLEQLFSIRGAASTMSDPLGSALLEITRPMMIVAALYTRRQTLMARPEWSAVTSKLNDDDQPSSSSDFAYLLDALAQLPLFYQERDEIISTQRQNEFTKQSDYRLIRRALHLRDGLSLFKRKWTVSHEEVPFSSYPEKEIPSEEPYPFSAITRFPSLEATNAFTLYNTLIILLSQFILSTFSLIPACEVEIVTGNCAREDLSAAIDEIMKSLHCQLSLTDQSSATMGSHNIYLLLPIRVAYKALLPSASPQDVPKCRWLRTVLEFLKLRGGPWMSNGQIFGVK